MLYKNNILSAAKSDHMKKKKKMVGVRCQCHEPPARESGMRTVMCPRCGKIYRTDKEDDICFSCQRR